MVFPADVCRSPVSGRLVTLARRTDVEQTLRYINVTVEDRVWLRRGLRTNLGCVQANTYGEVPAKSWDR